MSGMVAYIHTSVMSAPLGGRGNQIFVNSKIACPIQSVPDHQQLCSKTWPQNERGEGRREKRGSGSNREKGGGVVKTRARDLRSTENPVHTFYVVAEP